MKNQNLGSLIDGDLLSGQFMVFTIRTIPFVPFFQLFLLFKYVEALLERYSHILTTFGVFFHAVTEILHPIKTVRLVPILGESNIEFTVINFYLKLLQRCENICIIKNLNFFCKF